MIHELPWLPRATAAEHEAVNLIHGNDGIRDVAELMRLSGRAWNDSGLRAISRRLGAALKSIHEDWRIAARSAGCTPFSLLIVSSSTASCLTDALRASALRAGIVLECRIVEYQEPESWLAGNSDMLSSDPPDASLLALDRKALQLTCRIGDQVDAEHCVAMALDRYARIAAQASRLTGRAIITSTIPGSATDPQLSIDRWLPGSPRQLTAAFNTALAAWAREHSHAVFDAAALVELVGGAIWDAGRFGYLAKFPCAPDCIPLYAHRLVQLVAAMLGKSRRALVLDLDNTIWGGVVGDDGVEGIVLGAGNARGEAHLDIQKMAASYKERGIILCVASKNSEAIAREAFDTHPEMLLEDKDIAIFQINWNDKPSNMKAMSEALDLPLDAFVYLDDNPVEREQMRVELPMVATPELPDDPASWLPVVQAAAYFEQISFSVEDQTRTEYYKANTQRGIQARTIGDHAAFLESLQMVMAVAPFDAVGRARITQLISKSNQFNLTTRRYSECEVAALETLAPVETFQVRLKDKFGDNGMISVVICRKSPAYWEIDSWIMSCRVLGRGVEQAVLALIARRARDAGARELRGCYVPSKKNGLVRDHYARLGFTAAGEADDGRTTWILNLQEFVPRSIPIAYANDTCSTF